VTRKAKIRRDIKPREAGRLVRLAGLWPLLPVAGVLGVVLLAVGGLEHLKHRFCDSPECARPIKVELEYIRGSEWVEREDWVPRIASAINLPTNQSLMDKDLLRMAARQMMDSGWVRKVERVSRDMDGTIRMLCDYRRPIAMVATQRDDGTWYVPIDREGVRLPEEYRRVQPDSGWMLIVGLRSKLPPVGKAFGSSTPDNDAVSAVRLASMLFDREEVSSLISTIDVSNYGGRKDKFDTHIKLLTQDGRMVKWGSAVGREVEEPESADKLNNLAIWLKRHSAQAYADLSVYRNGVLVPMGQ
jgi:hypothetical protein